MGGAASVTLHPPHMVDEKFKQLLESKKARNHLFNEIANKQDDGHITLKNKISMKKLIHFFSDESHSFKVNLIVLAEAFKFTVKKKKHEEQMTKRDFHLFIPTLFLFINLWELFEEADKLVVEDKKIFIGEFLKIRVKLGSLAGVVIENEIDEETWKLEFEKLDTSKDGFISFDEFCKYIVANVVKPADYVDEFEHQEEDYANEAALNEALQAENNENPTSNALVETTNEGDLDVPITSDPSVTEAEALEGARKVSQFIGGKLEAEKTQTVTGSENESAPPTTESNSTETKPAVENAQNPVPAVAAA